MKKILIVCLFSFILSVGSALAIAMPAVSLPKITPITLGTVKSMNPLVLSRSVVGVPMTSGNYIVWQDNRNGNSDIYGLDKTNQKEFEICTAPGNPCATTVNQTAPFIDGDVIVWTDNSTSPQSVHAYRISTKKEIILNNTGANSKNVQGISGNIILWYDVWTNGGISTYRIMTYDYVGKTEPTPIASSIKNVPSSAIDRNIIVWADNKDVSNNYHIYAYDLSLNKKITVSTNTARQSNPTVSGNLIVWQDYRNSANGEIWGYDISIGKEFLIYSPSSGSVNSVHVGGRYVVFEKSGIIYAYHIAAKILKVISDGSHLYDNPSIKNNVAVWTDDTESNGNIFTANPNNFYNFRGDANGDGIVDSADLTVLENAFGTKPGDAKWNPNADFDKNLVIDSMDYLELKMDFGSYVETL